MKTLSVSDKVWQQICRTDKKSAQSAGSAGIKIKNLLKISDFLAP